MKKILLLGSLLCATLMGFSQVNNALSFDGSDDMVSIANQPLKDASSFTIEAQILNENAAPNEDVFMQFYDATDGRFELRFDSGKLSVYSDVLGTKTSTYTVPVGNFFHLALVKDASTTTLYVDGTSVLTFSGSYSLGAGLELGRYFTETIYSFKGKMDEIRFWNVAKTVAQMANTSACGLTGSEANLVGYWNFNQGTASGTNANIVTLTDKSVSKADGILSNFALTGVSSNWIASTTGCVEPIATNNALSFDGTDDFVSIGKQPLQSASVFTIEAMIMSMSTSGMIFQFYDQSNTRFEVRINSGKLAVYSQVLGIEPSSTFTVPVGTFFRMALVKDGQTTKLYADGNVVLTITGQYALGTGLQLGQYFTSGFNFIGQMDEIRFWNVAKTPNEIATSATCGLTGAEANLVGYWNFNQGIAAGSNPNIITLTDKSTSKADGTLNNFALTGTSSNWVASVACDNVVTSIEDATAINGIKVFPNPATSFIEIQGVENNSVVEIYSVSGQLVLSQELNGRVTLPASLDAGMYIVNVKGSKTSKHVIVKQ